MSVNFQLGSTALVPVKDAAVAVKDAGKKLPSVISDVKEAGRNLPAVIRDAGTDIVEISTKKPGTLKKAGIIGGIAAAALAAVALVTGHKSEETAAPQEA